MTLDKALTPRKSISRVWKNIVTRIGRDRFPPSGQLLSVRHFGRMVQHRRADGRSFADRFEEVNGLHPRVPTESREGAWGFPILR